MTVVTTTDMTEFIPAMRRAHAAGTLTIVALEATAVKAGGIFYKVTVNEATNGEREISCGRLFYEAAKALIKA